MQWNPEKMLSTLCRGQLNAVPLFSQPRCSISFGQLSKKIDCRLKMIESSENDRQLKKWSEDTYSKRIQTHIDNGDLKLPFEGKVRHQELIDEEKMVNQQHKLSWRFFLYALLYGTVFSTSCFITLNSYYHPLFYDILCFISPIGAFVSLGISGNAIYKSDRHKKNVTDLYKDICRKYQLPLKKEIDNNRITDI